MGYDLHITRAENWSDNDQWEIGANEWLAIVLADPDLELFPENGPYCAEWTVDGLAPGYNPWLDWWRGNIFTKYPIGRAFLAKMLEVAQRLDAKVQGDEGEFYSSPEEIPDL